MVVLNTVLSVVMLARDSSSQINAKKLFRSKLCAWAKQDIENRKNYFGSIGQLASDFLSKIVRPITIYASLQSYT